MYANELIGKKAIRTRPCLLSQDDGGSGMGLLGGIGIKRATHDYSHSTDPIIILAATENHIVFKYPEDSFFGKTFGTGFKPRILDSRWCDNKWTDYDELLKLASPEHMALMNQVSEQLGESQ